MTARCFALVPAAGTGSRAGSATPKQFLPVAGVPMIVRTLRTLATVAAIERIAVVVSADDVQVDDLLRDAKLDAWVDVLKVGGATRAESVANGLAAWTGTVSDRDWVLVHDAARCGLDVASVERLIEQVGDDDVGGILALPIDDTVKRETTATSHGASMIGETVDRRGLWRAQTPQMFRSAVLRDALVAARAGGTAVTDEASAVEAAGRRVLLVPGSSTNFKVTTKDDLAMMDRLLRGTSTENTPR